MTDTPSPIRTLARATAVACALTFTTVASAQPDAPPQPSEPPDAEPSQPAKPAVAPAPAPAPAPTPAAIASTSATSESGAAVGSSGSVFGVGGQLALSGFGGLQILYQTERYHIDGLISFFDAADTTVSVGGRFFYQLRQSERADFSLGAGLGFTHVNDADLDILHVEAVGQIRFWVAPTVVISATMGVALQTLDGDVVGLGSDLLGGAGITYLFR